MPAIVHDGVLVTESVAIPLYLADAFPAAGLAPGLGDPKRGPYVTWMAWYAAEMEPALLAALNGELEGAAQRRRGHEAVVRRLEGALAKGPYMMGAAFSAADVLVAGALAFGRRAFPDSAVLDAYVARCKGRQAALRAVALDDEAGVQGAA